MSGVVLRRREECKSDSKQRQGIQLQLQKLQIGVVSPLRQGDCNPIKTRKGKKHDNTSLTNSLFICFGRKIRRPRRHTKKVKNVPTDGHEQWLEGCQINSWKEKNITSRAVPKTSIVRNHQGPFSLEQIIYCTRVNLVSFSKTAFKCSGGILGHYFERDNFNEYKRYIFHLCIAPAVKFSLYECFVHEVLVATHPGYVYMRCDNIWEFVASGFSHLKKYFDVTEQYLRKSVAEISKGSNNSKHNEMDTIGIADFQWTCRLGVEFIETYFTLYNHTVKKSKLFSDEVIRTCVKKYEAVLNLVLVSDCSHVQLLERADLIRHNGRVKPDLIKEFSSCWTSIVNSEYSAIKETLFPNSLCTDFPSDNQYIDHHDRVLRRCLFIDKLEQQMSIALVSFLEINKSNIRKCLRDCLNLVESSTQMYETTMQHAIEVSSSSSEFKNKHISETSAALNELKRKIEGVYLVTPKDFLEAAKDKIEGIFEHMYLEFEARQAKKMLVKKKPLPEHQNNRSLIDVEVEEANKDSLAFAIDLNFSMVKVVGIDKQSISLTRPEFVEIFRVIPCMSLNEQGDVSLGNSVPDFMNRNDEPSNYISFNLENVLRRDNVTELHSCFVNGKKSEMKPDFILGLFFSKLKENVELKHVSYWRDVGVAVPHCFTMAQRMIIKQAAAIAGFESCVLFNNTSAAFYELSAEYNTKQPVRNWLIAIKNRYTLDVARYVPAEGNESHTYYKMQSSFCNIPLSNTKNWLGNLEREKPLYNNDMFLVLWAISCLEFEQKTGQNISIWHASFREGERQCVFLEKNHKSWAYSNDNFVSLGASQMLYQMRNYDLSFPLVRDITPYKIVAISSRRGDLHSILPYNAFFPYKFRHDIQCMSSIEFGEVCEGKFYSIGKLNKAPECDKLRIPLHIDSDGCLDIIIAKTKCKEHSQNPCNSVVPSKWSSEVDGKCFTRLTKKLLFESRKQITGAINERRNLRKRKYFC